MGVEKAYGSELTAAYDERHFGGRSGQYILQRDCSALQSLMGRPGALILDVPCGTGAYTAAFTQEGNTVVAADASAPMLELTGRTQSSRLRVLCDIGHLPFKDHSFGATMTLRLFSHCGEDEVARMLRQLKRVIRPGGRVIFDTFRWTPRRWPVLRRFLEQGVIHVVSHRAVEEMIAKVGLRKVEARSLYLFSPIWLRKLPLWAVRALTTVESLLPQRWLLRTFWACTKAPNSGMRGNSAPVTQRH